MNERKKERNIPVDIFDLSTSLWLENSHMYILLTNKFCYLAGYRDFSLILFRTICFIKDSKSGKQ